MKYTLTASLLTAAVYAQQQYGSAASSSAFPAGSTLSSGGYVCNPAHQYPSGQSCDGSGPTPTLVSYGAGTPVSRTAEYPAGSTLTNGGYVCNPAHQYPSGQSCDGSGPTPTLVSYGVGTPVSRTAEFPAGSTLTNGGYVCNPAHQYPSGQSCDGSGATPTLVSVGLATPVYTPATTSAAYPAGSTLPNGGYICNPAHQYPSGQSCDGSGPTPTLVSVGLATPKYTPAPSAAAPPAASTAPAAAGGCPAGSVASVIPAAVSQIGDGQPQAPPGPRTTCVPRPVTSAPPPVYTGAAAAAGLNIAGLIGAAAAVLAL